jgi:ligand-binding SRPBCC domain-containing protein
VAEFFRDASNLLKITPPFPRASIRGESRVFDGAVIGLVLSAGPFTARWDSMIERVDPDGTFVDVSRTPFFRRWRHTHRFVPDGAGCRIVDEVEAEPSLWFAPVAGLFVRSLFAYRKRALRRVFQ